MGNQSTYVSHRNTSGDSEQPMTETDLRTQAEEIHEQFSDRLDVDVEEIEERLDTLVNEYKVPTNEARRSVVNTYLDEAGMDRDDLSGGGGNEQKAIADIDKAEEWIDITAKVVELWDANSDAVAQVGLLGDETGTVKFTKWSKSDLPELREGAVYDLRNVVTDEYQGRFSVKLNRTTTIEEREEDIEVGDDSTEIEGALVDIQSGSGLIKRCPEEDCTRVLQNGRCSEHGEVEGEFDLRIKGVIDDGDGVHEVIFDREATEDLTGITLDRAQEMAMDALDTSVVADEMHEKVLGQYYRVVGPTLGRYVLANEFEELGSPADPEAVLIKARSI
jgi:ssDNA-binding replication factor A large subunit